MTKLTQTTTKATKQRKPSKKAAIEQLKAARLRQRIEREQNIDRWAGKSW